MRQVSASSVLWEQKKELPLNTASTCNCQNIQINDSYSTVQCLVDSQRYPSFRTSRLKQRHFDLSMKKAVSFY